ncbi:unnamed protein product [Clonostachys rosea f. rosea IK726]|uniref:Uncharacterized protein n=3 Tax=Bionectria ochroleuca TaxID=29856 RepID=A0A0B7KSE8_BIOOC|nr:unnamed protein product [Clonostachys rosea f. rosea IK726]CAG9956766.1 unnamed protein product [Clonostachys rosea f. rosea IK726]
MTQIREAKAFYPCRGQIPLSIGKSSISLRKIDTRLEFIIETSKNLEDRIEGFFFYETLKPDWVIKSIQTTIELSRDTLRKSREKQREKYIACHKLRDPDICKVQAVTANLIHRCHKDG